MTVALFEVRTPALVVDRARLARNVTRMARRADDAGVELWPHAKTHKSPSVASLQLAAGAVGLTVATVREAELFAEQGVQRLQLAQPPVGRWRVERLLALAQSTEIRVCLDSVEAASALDGAARSHGVELEVLWEIDCGLGRSGSLPGQPSREAIQSMLTVTECLRFVGVFTYGGQAYAATGRDDIRVAAEAEASALQMTVAALDDVGVKTPVRSVGSTPTALFLAEQRGITQTRPGNYVFHDATQVALGVADITDCALTVLGTIVSKPASDRVILDCGSKALANERMTTRTGGLGLVLGREQCVVERLFEEHAVIRVPPRGDLRVGDLLRVIPNHACPTANLHEGMHVVDDGDEIVACWPIAARGWGPQTRAPEPLR